MDNHNCNSNLSRNICLVMNWEKLKPSHYFADPIEHFYSSTLFDLKEYDKLYENQNNLSHRVWQDFDQKYRTGFTFHEDLTDIDKKVEIICLWFFRERSDVSAGLDINLNGKILKYYQNTFLITHSKNIKILTNENQYIRRPVLQLEMKMNEYKDLLVRFNKIA